MHRLTLSLALLLTSLVAQAQVYRCETAAGTVYSQMPCSESAERLPQYDPVVVPPGDPSAEADGTASESPKAAPPSPMENFISTLGRQRDDEIREIDANMKTLREQLNATGENAPDERTREMLEREMVNLSSRRAAISDQYASLISEARNRAGSPNLNN